MGETNPRPGQGGAYAHSLKDRPVAEWEPLPVHAAEVAALSARLAGKFRCAALGSAAGLLHDFGKYKPAFQRYLHDPSVTGKSHSGAGAVYARRHFGVVGLFLAHVVAGHHAGLKDKVLEKDGRLDREAEELDLALAGCARAADGFALPAVPEPPSGFVGEAKGFDGFQRAFLIRMLFSCLVDADRLCTERFYEGEVPRGPAAAMADLRAALDGWMEREAETRAAKGLADKPVNLLRAQVLAHVAGRASGPKGVFTLSVPTGGGKTLTSLAFALRHAEAHGLDRVIVVIPFTSVIEQSAAVYRTALAPYGDAVLEHHSAFDEGTLKGEARQGLAKLRLDMENWDARVVVTTAVQFFESLFSNRPSQCRKLHAIADSVVVLDEAQTMPLHLLRPCVAALKELPRNYGASVVLCTATQPALLERDGGGPSFAGGFRNVVELAPDLDALFEGLRRVTVRRIGEQDDAALAARFAEAEQCLCIVNARRHARELFQTIAAMPGARHLSTLMHAAHRSRVLAGIKDDLDHGRPCRVVSTSLIEAGVDVDFPLVMRAEAGLDQIAQSAGRLNREGKRSAAESLLLVFKAAGRKVLRELRPNVETGERIMQDHGERCIEPAAIEAYFSTLYWKRGAADLDRKGVLEACAAAAGDGDFPFETIAHAMRLIDDVMRPVIVADDEESRHWLAELRNPESPEKLGTIARKLQRYTVGIPEKNRAELLRLGTAECVRERVFGDQFVVLVILDQYKADIGFDLSDPTFMEAESLMV